MPTPHNPKNAFLCARHKALACNNSTRCRALVKRLHLEGRQAVCSSQWSKAIPILGTALESTETLLQQNTVSPADIEQYLKLSLELIYVCRKAQHSIHIDELIEVVKRQLEPHYSLSRAQKQLAPLLDVAFKPIAQVDYWMQLMLALEEKRLHTLQ